MKWAHIADIHVGIKRYGKVDASTGIHSRVLDTINSLSFAISKLIEHKVETVFIDGDIFTNRNPANVERALVAEQIARLLKEEIEVVVLVGNHDRGGFSNNFSMFEHLNVGKLIVVTEPTIIEKDGAAVVCIPWLDKNKYGAKTGAELNEVVVKFIKDLKKDLDPKKFNMLIGHLTAVGAAVGSERYFYMGGDESVPLEVLNDPIFDAVVLGHLHKHQILSEKGKKPYITYVGSLVRCDFNEREEAKGILIMEDVGKNWKPNFIRVPDRDFVQINVEFSQNELKNWQNELARVREGSVVAINIKVKRENKHLLDLKSIRKDLEVQKVHHLTAINVEVLGQTDRKVSFTASLSDEEMLDKFLREVRGYPDDFVKKVKSCAKAYMEKTI